MNHVEGAHKNNSIQILKRGESGNYTKHTTKLLLRKHRIVMTNVFDNKKFVQAKLRKVTTTYFNKSNVQKVK